MEDVEDPSQHQAAVVLDELEFYTVFVLAEEDGEEEVIP